MKNLILIPILIIALNCSTSKSDDNKSTLLAAYTLLNSSTTASCTTTIGTGVADWVKNSFTCVTVSVSGANYVFKSTSVPNYNSYYFGSSSSSYESSLYATTNKGNPNLISAQSVSLTIPITTTNASATSTSYGTIGLATNGISLYNDQAAPGDSLATEYTTFDSAQGHPTNTGSYHYHVEPPKISISNTNLVGIMQDGYLVFGKYHNASDTSSTNNTTGFTLGGTTSSTQCTSTPNDLPSTWSQLSNYRSTTGHTSSNSYHYHVNYGSGVNAIIISGKYIGTKI
jgi:hypothetical protein